MLRWEMRMGWRLLRMMVHELGGVEHGNVLCLAQEELAGLWERVEEIKMQKYPTDSFYSQVVIDPSSPTTKLI